MAEGVATRDRGLAGRAERIRRRAATVESRDHATALRRNNAELYCHTKKPDIQYCPTSGFSTDFYTEIEVYMSSL